MKETWRWFGPEDPVPLHYAAQAGATGIVSALHHLYRGEPWPLDEVCKRRDAIAAAGMDWSVVESIPMHNSIKLRTGGFRQYIGAWIDSMAAIARAGIRVICYNFMPVVDWVRTDIAWRLPSTGCAVRFDALDFAAYDLFVLRRRGAEADYSSDRLTAARERFERMTPDFVDRLERTLIAGLSASESSYDRESMRNAIAQYDGVTADDLRSSLAAFLREVMPVAEDLGLHLAIHPDDPPWSLYGLPRIVSTAGDLRRILAGYDSRSSGLTFCVGSLGSREDNNLVPMAREFGPRIHFLHLRQVRREADGSFHESDHLSGSSDMIGVIRAMLEEECHRAAEGRADWEIPMRPDHGHQLGDDIGKPGNASYSFVGRLKGLAELRGAIRGLQYAAPELNAQPGAALTPTESRAPCATLTEKQPS
ncbi:MAG TPA: mannonate dehydratase [Acidobacteriaceae bacterium]|nr:mannonate dehydratase [Acidobacteriaceae bacterium]